MSFQKLDTIAERKDRILKALYENPELNASAFKQTGSPIDRGITCDALIALQKSGQIKYNRYTKEWSELVRERLNLAS
jgi:hypothetical protein